MPDQTDTIELTPTAEKVAIDSFKRSLAELQPREREAALKIVDAVGEMTRERATITLALAVLATMPEDVAVSWSKAIIAGFTRR